MDCVSRDVSLFHRWRRCKCLDGVHNAIQAIALKFAHRIVCRFIADSFFRLGQCADKIVMVRIHTHSKAVDHIQALDGATSMRYQTPASIRWIVGLVLLCAKSTPADDVATRWESAYQATDATGPHVLGLWKFDSSDGADATGRLPKGTLQNGQWIAEGKFSGALESFAGFPEADRSHGFLVPHSPRLSPSGAFTWELWIKPKPELAQRNWAVLIDKKYAGHDDYQLSLGAVDTKHQRRLTLSLGFGADSQNFLSDPTEFPAGQWMHLAVAYDGRGRVRFFRNGESLGVSESPGRGPISAGSLPLSIGDRIGSSHPGFPGCLDEVRLTSGVREFGQVRLEFQWPRKAFVRWEAAPQGTVSVRNLQPTPLLGAKMTIVSEGQPTQVIELPEIPGASVHQVPLSFDTKLRPDTYPIQVSVTSTGEPARKITESTTVVLVPRAVPLRMPVVMWGIGGVQEVVAELPRLKQIGFTHCLGGTVDHQRIATSVEPTLTTRPEQMPATIEMLDAALTHDLKILAATTPSYFEPHLHEYLQKGRDGKPYRRQSLTPNAPPVMQAFERAGASIAKTFGEHPAFEGVLANSEVRDESDVSFTEWDLAAYRKSFGSGAQFPEWLKAKYPPNYSTLKDFPADRVVADDHPQLAFYRWWWSVGDGWNAAHSAVHHGMHQQSKRADLWSFNDPVVRCPPLWGSGGDVDVLSQWTYTDPDPLRMSLPVDELFAMASGRQPAARVMKMTQLFWYRSTTAPAENSPREGDSPARWVDQDPNTTFISIHPHHLREALWTKISRPVEGIMYHGWSSLVPTDGSHAYKYTHPQLQHELTRLIHEVVEPLGPTLRQAPAASSNIAFLESFTSFAFTAKSTWGYAGGWQADAYFALQHARLQPEVIYEQHVLRDGLGKYKVLVLVDCEVLTRPVVDRILAFQQAGGLVVGDDGLCPAIKADIILPKFRRKKEAVADKTELLSLAALLRSQLKGKYQRVVDTTSPEMIPHLRRAGSADYLFLVNDAREPGEYVGQYGMVHEQGVPTAAKVMLRSNAGALYDLVMHRSVPFERVPTENAMVFPVQLGPCDGRLLMAVERPIAQVTIVGPEEQSRGKRWSGKIKVIDDAGQVVDAVVPLRVDIHDADGRLAEYSGHYGAAGGSLDLNLDLATNDRPGVWEVRVTELASGQQMSKYVRVTR
jgi:hypothetical protein